MEERTLNLIFGLKIRQLRQQQGLTYQQLADKSDCNISFLHDIEKAKKRPSQKKILQLAQALGTDYDYLVSPKASKKLQPIIDLLESPFFKSYPLKEFGLDEPRLIDMLSHDPERVNAFISTILKVSKNYHLRLENLNALALRTYQDMHDNYFPDIESAAQQFKHHAAWSPEPGRITRALLEQALAAQFDIHVDDAVLSKQVNLAGLRSFYAPKRKVIYLNASLSTQQQVFTLARELGFQVLNIHSERPFESNMRPTGSFEIMLNNFKASYFASALLMDATQVADDFTRCCAALHWQADDWAQLLDKYQVSAETLLQRFTNVLPKYLGIKDLFFIRMQGDAALKDFQMTKELHLSGQQSPYASEFAQHYCRRWVSIDALRRLRAQPGKQQLVAVQLSKYWQTPNAYLCITMAKQSGRQGKEGTSVTLGMLVNDHLRRQIHFLEEPSLPTKWVHTTCETCAITDCGARVAPPTVLEKQADDDAICDALEALG